MAKVNYDKASDYFKLRVEQRFTHWIKRADDNVITIKDDLSKIRFWQFKKRRECENRLLASYLEIQIIKGAIMEIRMLQ